MNYSSTVKLILLFVTIGPNLWAQGSGLNGDFEIGDKLPSPLTPNRNYIIKLTLTIDGSGGCSYSGGSIRIVPNTGSSISKSYSQGTSTRTFSFSSGNPFPIIVQPDFGDYSCRDGDARSGSMTFCDFSSIPDINISDIENCSTYNVALNPNDYGFGCSLEMNLEFQPKADTGIPRFYETGDCNPACETEIVGDICGFPIISQNGLLSNEGYDWFASSFVDGDYIYFANSNNQTINIEDHFEQLLEVLAINEQDFYGSNIYYRAVPDVRCYALVTNTSINSIRIHPKEPSISYNKTDPLCFQGSGELEFSINEPGNFLFTITSPQGITTNNLTPSIIEVSDSEVPFYITVSDQGVYTKRNINQKVAMTTPLNSIPAGTWEFHFENKVGDLDVQRCLQEFSIDLTEPNLLAIEQLSVPTLGTIGSKDYHLGYCPDAEMSTTISINGGVVPYSVDLLKDGNIITTKATNSSASFTIDSPGTYTMQVTDANSCTANSQTFEINKINLKYDYVESSHIYCPGSTGSVSFRIINSLSEPVIRLYKGNDDVTSSYGYSYSNSQGSFTGLQAGTYQLRMKGSGNEYGSKCNNVWIEKEVTISNFSFSMDQAETFQPTCNNGNDGKIVFKLSGGDASNYNYQYALNTGSYEEFSSQSNPTISNLPSGNHLVKLKIGNCELDQISINIPNRSQQFSPNAGVDQTVCSNATNMSAALSSGQSGVWSKLSGSGIIDNPTSRSTKIRNLGIGVNKFRWTVTQGQCSYFDDVNITYRNVTNPSAGSDIFTRNNTVRLSANSSLEQGESAEWSSSSASFSEIDKHNSLVSNYSSGNNTLSWTIEQDACSKSDQLNLYYSNLSLSISNKLNERCGNDGSINVSASGGAGPGYSGGRYKYVLRKGGSFIASKISNNNVTFSGLKDGTYKVRVMDNDPFENNLTQVFKTLSISNATPVALDGTIKNSWCGDGKITLSASGGSGIYTYFGKLKNAPDSDYKVLESNEFNNLDPGVYTVKVESNVNDKTCSAIKNFTIGSVSGFAISKTINGSKGNDGNNYYVCSSTNTVNPKLNVTLPSGFSNVKAYLLKDGVTEIYSTTLNSSKSFNTKNIVPGTYTIGVENSNGCKVHEEIIHVSSISPTIESFYQVLKDNGKALVCNGNNDGEIILEIPKYDISGSFSAKLSALNYEQHNNNPQVIDEKLRFNFNSLSAKQSNNEVYSYSPSIKYNSSGECMWTFDLQEQLIEPDEISFNNITFKDGIDDEGNEIKCFGGNTNISGTVYGGANEYKKFILKQESNTIYSITNPTGSNFEFNNISAGNYTIEVFDINNCKNIRSITLNEPEPIILSLTEDPIHPDCIGGDNGSFIVQASGGNPWGSGSGYVYEIIEASYVESATSGVNFGSYINGVDPSINTSHNEATFRRPKGTYTVEVTDENGCKTGNYFSFTVPENPNPLTLSYVIPKKASCLEIADGQIKANANGGDGNYTFLLNNGTSHNSDPQLFTQLSGVDLYSLTVVDGNGCRQSTNVSPGIIDHVVSIKTVGTTRPLCNKVDGPDSSGSITVQGIAGRGDYSFKIQESSSEFSSDGTDKYEFQGLSPGLYTTIVRDQAGCTSSKEIVVPEKDSIVVRYQTDLHSSRNHDIVEILCPDESAMIDVIVESGSSPLKLMLEGVTEYGDIYQSDTIYAHAIDEINELTNVFSGKYHLVTIDSNNCKSVDSLVELRTAIKPEIILNRVIKNTGNNIDYHVTCNNGNDGEIEVYISPISEFGSFTIELITDGEATGTTKTITGGQSTSFHDLKATSNGDTIEYSFLVSNSLVPSCFWYIDDTFRLNQPEKLEFITHKSLSPKVNGFDISCADESIDYEVVFSGGIYPYVLYLKNGDTGEVVDVGNISYDEPKEFIFKNLTAASYTIELQDATSDLCETSLSFSLNAPPTLEAKVVSIASPSCMAGSDGVLSLTASGGKVSEDGYSYLMSAYDLASPFDITGLNCSEFSRQPQYGDSVQLELPAGSFDFKIIDDNGCTDRLENIIVLNPDNTARISSISLSKPSCYGGNDGSISISATGGEYFKDSTYQYILSGGDLEDPILLKGAENVVFTGLSSTEPGNAYKVFLRDSLQCCKVYGHNYFDDIEMESPDPIKVSIVPEQTSQPNCHGESSGSTITIEASGGTPPYLFSLNGLDFDSSSFNNQFQLSNIPGGSFYNFYIRDSKFTPSQSSCTIPFTYYLAEGPKLSVELETKNVSCYGGTDGYAEAYALFNGSLSGMNANSLEQPGEFNFTWKDLESDAIVSTNQYLSNVGSGSYSLITSRKGSSCSFTTEISILEPASPLSLNISEVKHESCKGSEDGELHLSINGGLDSAKNALKYSIDGVNFISLEDKISNLTGGSYQLIVENAIGCRAYDSITISTRELVIEIEAVDSVSCHNGSDGRIRVNTSVNSPYLQLPEVVLYSIDGHNYQAANEFISLEPGEYNIFLKDENNHLCTAKSEPIILENPEEILIDIELISEAHCQMADGEISIDVQNADDPTTRILTLNGSIADAMNLAEGTYTVQVIDSKGCYKETTAEVTEAAPMKLETIISDAYCNLSNGSANVHIFNGSPPYEVSWKNQHHYLLGPEVDSLFPGEYILSVVDSFNCLKEESIQVPNTPAFQVDVVEIVGTACGSELGKIEVEPIGMYEPYVFQWSTGSATNKVEGLRTGQYHLSIVDDKSCVYDSTFVISPDSVPITSVIEVTYPVCNAPIGILEIVDVQGGEAPYQYEWLNNELVFMGSLKSIDSLRVGRYFLNITDARGCKYPQPTIDLISDSSKELKIEIQTSEAYCNKQNASVDVSFFNGQPPFHLLLKKESGDVIVDSLIHKDKFELSALFSGVYELQVVDEYMCSTLQKITVKESDPPIISVRNVVPATAAIPAGSINLEISETYGEPYTYQVTDSYGMVKFFDSPLINELTSGQYSIIAFSESCTTNEIIVDVPAYDDLVLSIDSVVRPTCKESSNGFIRLEASGGRLPYRFKLDSHIIDAALDSLNQHDYVFLVEDAIGTIDTLLYSLNAYKPISILNINKNNPSCHDNLDGSIAINIENGSGNYDISWSNGAIGPYISDIGAGIYKVHISDRTDPTCAIDSTIQLYEPEEITVSTIRNSPPSCAGGTDGLIEISVDGGSGLFDIEWPDGQNGLIGNGLTSGNYSIEIMDKVGGCQISYEAYLKEKAPIMIYDTLLHLPTCHSGNNGSIALDLINTSNPQVTWSTGNVGKTLTGIGAGTYQFDIIDEDGCELSGEIELLEPAELRIRNVNITETSCSDSSDGSIEVEIIGGTGFYEISWWLNDQYLSDKKDQLVISKLPRGRYRYLINDQNFCSVTGEVEVTGPSDMKFDDFLTTNPSCYASNDGSILINVSGGSGNYQYYIDNELVDNHITTLSSGSFELLVIDDSNCILSKEFTLKDPLPLVIASNDIKGISCFNENDGEIYITPNGGTPPYRYAWSNGETTQQISGLREGVYNVSVYDSVNCLTQHVFYLNSPDELEVINLQLKHPTCSGGSDGAIALEMQGGTPPYQYDWGEYGRDNSINNLTEGSVNLNVIDSNNCLFEETYQLYGPEQKYITGIPKETTICNGSNFRYEPDGNWANVSWYFNDVLVTSGNTFDALEGGDYNVIATDDDGCQASTSFTVTALENPLNADFVFDSEIETGDTIIFIDISWPVPQHVEWVLPDSIELLTADESLFYQEVVFNSPGIYKFGMKAYDEGCVDFIEQLVEVHDHESVAEGRWTEKQQREVVILESLISPNPTIGDFEVEVKLSKPSPAKISFYDFERNQIDSQKNDLHKTTHYFNIRERNLVAGIYLLLITAGEHVQVKKVIVK